jgi:2-oxoglutarate dehydrogenase E1 component
VSKEKKILNLERILWADSFSKFLENKFNTMKRFGLEGCESFIPGLKVTLDTLVERGCEKVVIGMPHRGRLNVLANVVHKPLEKIFSEFEGKQPAKGDDLDEEYGSGDVKYHLGTTYEKSYPNGKKLAVTLLANPSHLETVNPVAMGRARCE